MTDTRKARGRLLVLLALADGPKHGYEISKHLTARTNGFFRLSFGALYPILHRLEKQRLIAGTWEDVGPAKQRKVYTLTARGRAALDDERREHEAMSLAFARLLGERA